MNLFVVLPAYNETANLKPLLPSLSAVADKIRPAHMLKVIVVDDGSSDETAAVVQANPIAEYIRHDKNKGFPQALRTGLTRAIELSRDSNDAAVVMDADNTHPAETLIPMIEKFSQGYDVVIASRFTDGGSQTGVSAFRTVLSKGCGWILDRFFRVENVKDYTSSFRMIRMKTLKALASKTGGQFYKEESFVCACEFLFNLKSTGAKFSESPLKLRWDLRQGHSKMKVTKTIWGYVRLMRRMRGEKIY